jgi:tetratricopeptide (TPR) repeat protein
MKNTSLRGFLKIFTTVIILSALLIITSCGPTNEEIMAMERAQAQERIAAEAERARAVEVARKQKQMEDARLAKILATEKAGDEAARQGELEKALDNYQEVLKNVQRYGEQDQRIRQSVIKVVRAMHAPPAIPESVMRSMVRAETRLKMGGTGSYAAAATEMEQAVLYAPWLADAYFNLGTVQEKAGKFNEAMQNFKLYLLAAPRVQNANAIQAKIYELEVLKEDQDKLQTMQGEWDGPGGRAVLTVEGPDILISYNSRHIKVQKKGFNLEGFCTIVSRAGTGGPGISGMYGTPCTLPEETIPISGVIGDDGSSIVFRMMSSDYKENYEPMSTAYYDDDNGVRQSTQYVGVDGKCTGVVLMGKSEEKIILRKSK